jgi:hypothetical protein
MNKIGPPLPAITRRIAETPSDFLGEPRLGRHGAVAVDAVLGDVLRALGVAIAPTLVASFASDQPATQRNRLKLGAITAWLLADEWLRTAPPSSSELADFLLAALPELAEQASAESYVTEADRREELARTMLARFDLRPESESPEQARDRLSIISATERARLIAASRQAEQRAREVREALARKAAQESADKWTRE